MQIWASLELFFLQMQILTLRELILYNFQLRMVRGVCATLGACRQSGKAYLTHWQLADTLAADLRQIPTTKKLVLAGDFNADIGANAAIPDEGRFDVTTDRVRGPFGLGRRTQAGLGLEAWARELGLCFWATFQRQRRRGTWQHRRTHAWHGLEWFVGRVGERGALVQKCANYLGRAVDGSLAKSCTYQIGRRAPTMETLQHN